MSTSAWIISYLILMLVLENGNWDSLVGPEGIEPSPSAYQAEALTFVLRSRSLVVGMIGVEPTLVGILNPPASAVGLHPQSLVYN